MFFEHENPLLISQQLSNRPDVIITDGKNPCCMVYQWIAGNYETPTHKKLLIQLAQVMLSAGLISKLISSGYPSNELEIEDCIKFAVFVDY